MRPTTSLHEVLAHHRNRMSATTAAKSDGVVASPSSGARIVSAANANSPSAAMARSSPPSTFSIQKRAPSLKPVRSANRRRRSVKRCSGLTSPERRASPLRSRRAVIGLRSVLIASAGLLLRFADRTGFIDGESVIYARWRRRADRHRTRRLRRRSRETTARLSTS